MHPAPSLIAFTTLSGAGFGLMAFLGLGWPSTTGRAAFGLFFLAYLLAVGGLSASTLHLGHPERALMAFREWRSSWLSREAWAAVATLLVMAPFGAGLAFFGLRLAPLGWLGAALALATVVATAMIYAQMQTVPRWRHWSTPALFVAYALTGGALLAGQTALALVVLLPLGVAQAFAWAAGDARARASRSDLASATGLGGTGRVRAFEPPHTGESYLTREMVHVVARKHARRLRLVGLGLASVLPFAALAFAPPSPLLGGLAALSHLAGVGVIRWLFFAEAEHVVGLYYGRR